MKNVLYTNGRAVVMLSDGELPAIVSGTLLPFEKDTLYHASIGAYERTCRDEGIAPNDVIHDEDGDMYPVWDVDTYLRYFGWEKVDDAKER